MAVEPVDLDDCILWLPGLCGVEPTGGGVADTGAFCCKQNGIKNVNILQYTLINILNIYILQKYNRKKYSEKR